MQRFWTVNNLLRTESRQGYEVAYINRSFSEKRVIWSFYWMLRTAFNINPHIEIAIYSNSKLLTLLKTKSDGFQIFQATLKLLEIAPN